MSIDELCFWVEKSYYLAEYESGQMRESAL